MNLQRIPNINYLWSSLIVEELIRQGIHYFCLSPGSRSAPLAIAAGLNSQTKTLVHYDERGTAFHALGCIAGAGKPAVVISTSGTAVANFFPAVIEASKKKLPLIVLTADRPPELRRTGSEQTIEQSAIFGEYVRFSMDLPCPDFKINPRFVLTTIDQAVSRAQGELRGPVHVNCMFREPLAPLNDAADLTAYSRPLSGWLKSKTVFTHYTKPETRLSQEALIDVARILNKNIKNGLIAVGKLSSRAEEQSVLQLAKKLNWPILPDITSGLRFKKNPQIINYFDQILLSDQSSSIKCDGILQLGGRMTSKRFQQFTQEINVPHYLMVLNHPLRNDPAHQITQRIQMKVENFCNSILPEIKTKNKAGELTRWKNMNLTVERTLTHFFQNSSKLTEPWAARKLSELIPDGTGLFLANSMPIREMDMFAQTSNRTPIIGANRGASGIDGLIASASGFSVGLKRPVTLMIGDLAFLHDLNSLKMLTQIDQPVIIVILNNDGGAIFSFLPIAEFPEHFEKFFGTPHGLNFENAARQFELDYYQPKTTDDFKNHYATALKKKKPALIEIKTDRKENLELHRTIQKKIKTALEGKK